MARNKKIVEEVLENAVEEIVNKPVIQEPIEETDIQSDDSVVQRVVSKVKQVITLKKVLTEKQQKHIDKLAAERLGKKSTYKELPVETVALKPKAKRTVKPKVELKVEPIVPVKIVKLRVKKPIQVFQEPIINLSKFNKNLF